MSRQPPDGIERLTPSQAWSDGYRIGREDLAASLTADAAARAEKDGRTVERLDAMERTVKLLQDNANDAATRLEGFRLRIAACEGLIAAHEERIESCEEGP